MVGQSPLSSPPAPGTVLSPGRALGIPLGFTVVLVAFGLLPAIRQVPALRWSLWGAAVVLLAWNAGLLALARWRGRALIVEVSLRPQHYVQACAHTSILLYWGWYWPEVYHAAPLIAAQLAFAYAFDALLAWSRRDAYALGFGPLPIIFSTNLFLWFKPDWFYLQFVLVALGFAAKALIRWNKDGRRVHVFNPSSFPLSVASLILLLTGTTAMTWGPEIATTQFNPPHIYLLIFLVALPGQFLFGVASMTLSAVGTFYAFCLAYYLATGSHYFLELPIPIAIFLGMHLLFTDPSTSPRTELGRIVFGMLYGLSVLALFMLLDRLGLPTFYDKLLPVPILNLMIQGIDRLGRSGLLKRLDPGGLGRNLAPRRRNLAYIAVWAVIFGTMQAQTGTQATLARGDSLKAQGLLDEAIARYREFLRTSPSNFEGQTKLAAALLDARRPDEGVPELQRAVELKPDNPEALNTLGATLMKLHRFQEALPPLERAAALQPRSADARTALGMALLQSGRAVEAVASLQRATALRPDSAEANNTLGMALIEAGRFGEAISALQRAVELQPGSLEASNNLGAALVQAGRFDEAVAWLQRAVDLHPDSAEAYNNLGVTLVQVGRVDAAVAPFQRAVELQPQSAEAQHTLGVTLLQAGRVADAVAPLQRAVAIQPDFPEARYNLSNALVALGDPKGGADQLRELLRMRADWPPALTSLSWLEATDAGAVRNPAEAVRLASRAADLSQRRDAHVLDVLAAAYAAAGRFRDAENSAEAGAALASQSDADLAAEIRSHLAVYRTGRPLMSSASR
jgi:Flp pilus assembly protein TadD